MGQSAQILELVDAQLLAYQYLQTLPKLANGDGNHTWLIPSELTRALDAFASGFVRPANRTNQHARLRCLGRSGRAAADTAGGYPRVAGRRRRGGPRSVRGEQAPGTQHHEQDDARRTG